MKQTIVRKSKWFWPWQDAEEEAWLEQLSRHGLHLKQAYLMAQYDFVPGQPADYIYRLDFRSSLNQKNKDDYLRLFSDAGWEYVGEMGGWQYFRKFAQQGEEGEIFTDHDTKVQKYQRFLTWFLVSFPSSLFLIIVLLSDHPGWLMWAILVIFLALSALWAVVAFKVRQRIQQLRAL